MAYKTVGSTSHYSIFYDTSILTKADGEDRANKLKAVCENDFALMSAWFTNVTIRYSPPFVVRIEAGGGNYASWGSDSTGLFPISIFANTGESLDLVRYLLVCEVTEMFMESQINGSKKNKGWYGQGSEGSNGEGLSLFLGRRFLLDIGSGVTPAGVASSWLDSSS